jgi:hypothetical protein
MSEAHDVAPLRSAYAAACPPHRSGFLAHGPVPGKPEDFQQRPLWGYPLPGSDSTGREKLSLISIYYLPQLIMSKIPSQPHPNSDAQAKRLLDILASALGLLLLSPFFGIIAWAIKRDSPGPIFYRGRRVGQHGKEFTILKFRTMYEYPCGGTNTRRVTRGRRSRRRMIRALRR